MMTVSHLIFAGHVLIVLARGGPQRRGAPWRPEAMPREVSA
jgi:hypothetical protein